MIVLSLVLSCCTTENTQKETVNAEPLTDGTATYYENEKDMNGKLLHSTRYTKDGRIVEEYEYSYTYDINGKLTTIRKTDLNSGNHLYKYDSREQNTNYHKTILICGKQRLFKQKRIIATE